MQTGGESVTEMEFWQRVEMCKERLWRLGRMWLGSDAAAVDVLDEAVLRAYIALPKLRHGIPLGLGQGLFLKSSVSFLPC